uniref:Reverse transcriptase Ty1/copia-type domain-containing protein n=1 Tax=Tanacetum cinerariifolium TaxID=118510 RepID=A0A6L2LFI8_TANCI|nr:hypothetical protein [Tanacetum cinerariifolium]
MGFNVYQIDVKSAFLYGTIKEEVYVCQPLGFKDPDYLDKVYKVVKAIYKLHQAPRAWYETLANYLLENGFQRGKIDQTLFIKKQKGLQVKRKQDGIFISQDKYIAKILRKFGLIDGKSASTPIDTEKPLLKDPDSEDVDVHTYRSMTSSLMYLTLSRPDIMFAVCAEIKTQLQIIPNDEDDVYTEATPLALKVPVVDYQIYYKNNKPFYKIIRADETHKLFLSFITILKNFDIEDLEMLLKLVQERFQSLEPKEFSDDFLLNTFKIMFEKPNVKASIWRDQRGIYGLAKVKSWKLFESCGVHIITFTTTQMILLVERKYPLTRFTLEQMLNNVRLEVEEESEMSLELLRVVSIKCLEADVKFFVDEACMPVRCTRVGLKYFLPGLRIMVDCIMILRTVHVINQGFIHGAIWVIQPFHALHGYPLCLKFDTKLLVFEGREIERVERLAAEKGADKGFSVFEMWLSKRKCLGTLRMLMTLFCNTLRRTRSTLPSHDKYVAEILRKFGLTDEKLASTPIDTEKPLLKDFDGKDVDVHTYRSMIGSLMYLTSSRPDIMFAVCACCKKQIVVATSSTEAEYVAAPCKEYSSTKFYMYPRFLQLMIRAQVGDLSSHTTKYSSSALIQKVFANMRRAGKGFSRVNTPLFEGAASVDVDDVFAAVDEPSIPSPTPATQPPRPSQDLPSTSQVQPTLPPSIIAQPPLPQQQQSSHDAEISMDLLHTLLETCTTLTRRGRIIAKDVADVAKEVVVDAEIKESADDDEVGLAELQEVVEVVTTAKLMTKVVTVASATITAADTRILAATITFVAPTLTTAPSTARRRKGVVIRDPKETATPSIIVHSEAKSKDKGKGILVEEPKPFKKQAQIKQDKAYARELEMEYFKGMKYDDIRLIFEKYFNSNVAFLENTKEQMEKEDSRELKRANESQAKKATKKQKLDEEVAELKRHL